MLAELREKSATNWKVTAKIFGAVCLTQTVCLIVGGFDRDERDSRLRHMERVDDWMTQIFTIVKGCEKRLDDQDRINSAVKDWILEHSKRNGTKYSGNRGDQ